MIAKLRHARFGQSSERCALIQQLEAITQPPAPHNVY
jgi:hypothetical protein